MENIAVILGLILAIPLWFLFHKLFYRVYFGNVFFKIIGELLGAWFVGYLIAGFVLTPFTKLLSQELADNVTDIDLESIGGVYCISNAEYQEVENYYIAVYSIYTDDARLVYDAYRYSIDEARYVGDAAYNRAILEKSSGVMEYEKKNNVFYSTESDGTKICLLPETNELNYDTIWVLTPVQSNVHSPLSEEEFLSIVESTALEYGREFLQPETDEAFYKRLEKASMEYENHLVSLAVQLQTELYNHYASYGIYLPEDMHPADYYDHLLKNVHSYNASFETIDEQYLMFETASNIWNSYAEDVTYYIRSTPYPFESITSTVPNNPADFELPTDEEGWVIWAESMMVEYNLPRSSDSPFDTLFYYLAAEGSGELSPADDTAVAQLKADHPEYDVFMLWVETYM